MGTVGVPVRRHGNPTRDHQASPQPNSSTVPAPPGLPTKVPPVLSSPQPDRFLPRSTPPTWASHGLCLSLSPPTMLPAHRSGPSMPASWPQDWVETPWPGARGRPSSPNPDRPLVVMNFAPSYLWARPQRVPPLGMSCAMAGTPGHGTSRGPSSSSADVTVVPPLTGSALPTRPLLPREQGHLHSSLCSQDQTNVPSDSSCSTATLTPRPWTDRSAELSLSIFSYTINGLVARLQSENVYSRTQKGVWHHASWRGHKPSPRLRAAFQNRW